MSHERKMTGMVNSDPPFFPNCGEACRFRTYVIFFPIFLFLIQAYSPWLKKGTTSHCGNTL